MQKILTISVAAYNAEKYLEKCLESFVINDILDVIEVIIVDDGSSDGTKDIAEEFVGKFPNTFKLIRKQNGGHGSTINTGILNAKGKYFKIVDADDWVERDGITKLVNILLKVDVDMILNNYFTVDDNTNEKILMELVNKEYEYINRIVDIEEVCNDIKFEMHGIVFKTDILKNMNKKITENCFYVDVEYILFPIIKVKNVLFLDFPIYDYRKGLNEQSTNFINKQKRRNQHRKVCFNILEYYNDIYNFISIKKAQLIKKRIMSMVLSQYRIYFSMKANKQILNEIKSFDGSLKIKNINIYNDILIEGKNIGAKKLSVFIYIIRKSKFILYMPIIKTIR